MIPPALAADLDQIALRRFTTPLDPFEFALVRNAAARLGQAATEREPNPNQFINLADRAGVVHRCAVVMSYPSKLWLGITHLRVELVSSPVGIDGTLTSQSITNDCTT